MIVSDFILHCALYSVPLFWCGTVLYTYIKSIRLLQRSTTFYFVLIILYGSSQLLVWLGPSFMFWPLVWALGRALCVNFWYGLGPSFMSQLLVWAWTELNLPLSQKGMGSPFYGLISYINFPTSSCVQCYVKKHKTALKWNRNRSLQNSLWALLSKIKPTVCKNMIILNPMII